MKKIFVCLCFLCCALLFVYSLSQSGNSAIKELFSFCAESLIPTLFPSIAICTFLMKSGILQRAISLIAKPLAKCFGLSLNGTACAFCGILCGFPASAVAVAELRKSGDISESEAVRICAVSSLPSVAFAIGFVGSLFQSNTVGIMLYLCVFGASLIVGKILYLIYGKSVEIGTEKYRKIKIAKPVSDGIREGVIRTAVACGAVVLFSAMGEMLCSFFGYFGFRTVIFGVLEFSRGTYFAGKLYPAELSLTASAAVLGFSGMSVMFQIKNAYPEIKIGFYLLIRTLISVISALLCLSVLCFGKTYAIAVSALCLFFVFFGKKPEKSAYYKKNTEKAFKSSASDF